MQFQNLLLENETEEVINKPFIYFLLINNTYLRCDNGVEIRTAVNINGRNTGYVFI
jgi:hypothetical protein